MWTAGLIRILLSMTMISCSGCSRQDAQIQFPRIQNQQKPDVYNGFCNPDDLLGGTDELQACEPVSDELSCGNPFFKELAQRCTEFI